MRTYERNGVHVDQCSDCRGIFLDRGELDRLIDAEKSWHGESHSSSHGGSQSPTSVVTEVLSQVRGQKHASSDRSYGKKRKESFLSDLFG
jgi:Zn-finger nucleic acid-binding protein